MSTNLKIVTVRLPLAVYERCAEIARRRRISLAALAREGLVALVRQEEDARLQSAFDELGEDPVESSVEFAAHAQWEVVCRDDS